MQGFCAEVSVSPSLCCVFRVHGCEIVRRLSLSVSTDVVTCLAQVRRALKTLHIYGCGARLVRAICFVMATAELQFTALMQQSSQLVAAVNQMAQIQQARQAGETAGGAGTPIAKILDLRHLKCTTLEGTLSKYDDWAFSFKRPIRSASCQAYNLLAHVE